MHHNPLRIACWNVNGISTIFSVADDDAVDVAADVDWRNLLHDKPKTKTTKQQKQQQIE